MLAVKLLGIADIFAAIFFWIFGIFGFIPPGIIIFFGFVLLVKGIIFIITGFNITSLLDLICGAILISATSFPMNKIVVIIVALFLLQKGIFSLLG